MLQDAQACKDAALRYCRGVDRLDPDEMKSAYWPDATDDHGNFVGNAHEFVDYCMEAHLRWRSTMHCVLNHLVEVDDDHSARGEIYNVTYLFRKDEPVLDTWWGRYLDRYEKRGDEWRIIERVCVNEGSLVTPIAEAMPMNVAAYRPGSFDRPAAGRPMGP
ncbi:MAG: nuclear transport factor 2 family protein [Acidimicrobiales bacterium]